MDVCPKFQVPNSLLCFLIHFFGFQCVVLWHWLLWLLSFKHRIGSRRPFLIYELCGAFSSPFSPSLNSIWVFIFSHCSKTVLGSLSFCMLFNIQYRMSSIFFSPVFPYAPYSFKTVVNSPNGLRVVMLVFYNALRVFVRILYNQPLHLYVSLMFVKLQSLVSSHLFVLIQSCFVLCFFVFLLHKFPPHGMWNSSFGHPQTNLVQDR